MVFDRYLYILLLLSLFIMDIDTSRQITIRRTQAGGALLIYDEFGNTFMVPKGLVLSVINGFAKGNMVKANFIGKTDPKRFNANFDPSKIRAVEGVDPLSREGGVVRQGGVVKVDGDDW